MFGRQIPAPEVEVANAYIVEDGRSALDTEQQIEDRFPVDIRYFIKIDCDITQKGFRKTRLRELLVKKNVPLFRQKKLEFWVVDHSVPREFTLYWKVLNRGSDAIRRNCIRGQIVPDAGQMRKSETTDFKGNHIVECYAVMDGVVVAKDRIQVPISNEIDPNDYE